MKRTVVVKVETNTRYRIEKKKRKGRILHDIFHIFPRSHKNGCALRFSVIEGEDAIQLDKTDFVISLLLHLETAVPNV